MDLERDTTVEDVSGRYGPGCGNAVSSRWRRVVERWSPVGLRGARTDPGRRAAAVLMVVAALAAAAVALITWTVARDPR